jgi:hypothetical protein
MYYYHPFRNTWRSAGRARSNTTYSLNGVRISCGSGFAWHAPPPSPPLAPSARFVAPPPLRTAREGSTLLRPQRGRRTSQPPTISPPAQRATACNSFRRLPRENGRVRGHRRRRRPTTRMRAYIHHSPHAATRRRCSSAVSVPAAGTVCAYPSTPVPPRTLISTCSPCPRCRDPSPIATAISVMPRTASE